MNKGETLTAWGLGAAGALKGIAELIPPAGRAWALMGLGILGYEVFCPVGQTLSEGADRALESHKVITLGGIALIAGHLANIIPERVDPIHKMTAIFRG